MGKKVFYFIFAVILGGFIVMQSCNESPIVQNEPYSFEQKGHILPEYSNNGILTARIFYGIGTGKPIICGTSQKIPIIAAQAIEVGYVEFTEFNSGTIKGNFHFNDPPNFSWAIEEIQMHFATTYSGIPQNPSGNPVPGNFKYNIDFNPANIDNVIPFTYIDNTLSGSEEFYVAIHMVVCKYGGVEGYNLSLPDGKVNFNLQREYEQGYFKIDFYGTSAGFLMNSGSPGQPNGTYFGYCMDKDRPSMNEPGQCGVLISSYEDLMSYGWQNNGILEHPENFDLVNYIINTYPIGTSTQVLGATNNGSQTADYTVGQFSTTNTLTGITDNDIQNAIWSLLDDLPPNQAWMEPRNYEKVWGMIYDALLHGEGFLPGCNQRIVTLLIPVDCQSGDPILNKQIIIFQPMIFDVGLPCYTNCETAWGDGIDGANFVPNKNWATYFKWNKNNCPPLLK